MREETRARLRSESARIPDDVDLIERVEGLRELGLYRWELDILERASERLYGYGRALLERQREKLEDMLKRRTGAGDDDAEGGW